MTNLLLVMVTAAWVEMCLLEKALVMVTFDSKDRHLNAWPGALYQGELGPVKTTPSYPVAPSSSSRQYCESQRLTSGLPPRWPWCGPHHWSLRQWWSGRFEKFYREFWTGYPRRWTWSTVGPSSWGRGHWPGWSQWGKYLGPVTSESITWKMADPSWRRQTPSGLESCRNIAWCSQNLLSAFWL